MKTNRWRLISRRSDEVILKQRLTEALGIHPLVARILINRGVTELGAARAFLSPDFTQLSDPFLLPGMQAAVERLEVALRENEKIVIYGDYDADGVTATVLLIRLFNLLGRSVDYYIPQRAEGYGLNFHALDHLARMGTKLIITVDCGISDKEEISYAKKLGMDVIITDHHEPPEELPQAIAIINPKLNKISCFSSLKLKPSDLIKEHPALPLFENSVQGFTELAGVGVVFKLAWALTQRLSRSFKSSKEYQEFLGEAMVLTAIGTIADVVPLCHENRIFTVYGLELLRNTRSLGLRALIETSGLDYRSFKPQDISFRIGPRLNAGGRLEDARLGVELLLTSSPARASELAQILEKINRVRQRLEARILNEAKEKIIHEIGEDDFVIVLAQKNWHFGVIGIVASKLSEEFHRPCVLFSLDTEPARGSARSIPNFHIYQALATCRSMLCSLGGHTYAAGLEIAQAQLPRFKEAINQYAKTVLKKEDLIPTLEIDEEIHLKELSRQLVRSIEKLGPFGEGNPEPILVSSNLSIAGMPRLVGSNERHLTFIVRQGEVSFPVLAYQMADLLDEILKLSSKRINLAYTPVLNNWQDEEKIVLILKDIRPVEA